MIGTSVARMEEQVAKAEAQLGTLPSIFRKFLHTIHMPSFNKALQRPQQMDMKPRPEDHFPCYSGSPGV